MARRLLHLLRRDRGQAALETLISVPLIFIAIIAMWAAMIVIYNQATMNSATQAAAQGAITVFDRTTYRATGSGYKTRTPREMASNAATAIFTENSRGMLAEQFGNAQATAGAVSTSIDCAPDFGAAFAPCASDQGSAVERVSVSATATTGYWLLGPVANSLDAEDENCAKVDSDTCQNGASAEISRTQTKVDGMKSVGVAVSAGPN